MSTWAERAKRAKGETKKDCIHYNKDRCDCRILNDLYCKKEAKPCSWYKQK